MHNPRHGHKEIDITELYDMGTIMGGLQFTSQEAKVVKRPSLCVSKGLMMPAYLHLICIGPGNELPVRGELNIVRWLEEASEFTICAWVLLLLPKRVSSSCSI